MFANLKNIFKVEDLRKKVFFTFLMIMVYRFGTALRVPGVDAGAVAQLREASKSQGALGFLNLFSGGAFGSFSIFALGIMPYITASIIIQLAAASYPALNELRKEGELGRRKLNQYTRYLAVVLAFGQGFGLAATRPSQAPGRYAQWMDELKSLHRGDSALKPYADVAGVAQRLMKTNQRLPQDKADWLAQHWAQAGADGQWRILGDRRLVIFHGECLLGTLWDELRTGFVLLSMAFVLGGCHAGCHGTSE